MALLDAYLVSCRLWPGHRVSTWIWNKQASVSFDERVSQQMEVTQMEKEANTDIQLTFPSVELLCYYCIHLLYISVEGNCCSLMERCLNCAFILYMMKNANYA